MSTLDLFTEAESDVEVIARGAFLLRGFVADTDATLLAEIVRISKVAPFRHMVTPAGYRVSAAMTNCGPAGWTTRVEGHPQNIMFHESAQDGASSGTESS